MSTAALRYLNIRSAALSHRLDASFTAYNRQSQHPDPTAFSSLYNLITDFETFVGHCYQVRTKLKSETPERVALEDQLAHVSSSLVSLQKEPTPKDNELTWQDHYRRVWRENFNLFLITAILFLICSLVGAGVAILYPDYTSALLSVDMMENILEKKKWFDSIQSNPLFYGMQIAVNNIMVSINCCVFGALLGLGGLYILCYNGLSFGAVLGFCLTNGFHNELLGFVTSHGILELTIIVASAFASFIFGKVFYMRPYKLFKKRLAHAAREASYVLMGILPWLLVAAFLEVFISPWPGIPFELKMMLSFGVTALFWTWTFRRRVVG